MPRLIWVFAGRTIILLVLSWGGSKVYGFKNNIAINYVIIIGYCSSCMSVHYALLIQKVLVRNQLQDKIPLFCYYVPFRIFFKLIVAQWRNQWNTNSSEWHTGNDNWAASWRNQQSECAPSEDSDQPGYPPSLIRVLAIRMKKAWILSYPLSAREDSDQTGRMPRLIWVFAGRTSLFWFCREAVSINEAFRKYNNHRSQWHWERK